MQPGQAHRPAHLIHLIPISLPVTSALFAGVRRLTPLNATVGLESYGNPGSMGSRVGSKLIFFLNLISASRFADDAPLRIGPCSSRLR
jgi:hypothetical protein